jgi:hypothetical protein
MKSTFLLILLCVSFLAKADNEDDFFSLSIENDNLIVCLKHAPTEGLAFIELRLRGGKRIKINPTEKEACGSLFYLDSQQALMVKKKGIKSIVYHQKESAEKVHISESQNRQFISSLP